MKTMFDKATRDELVSRINILNENSVAQWGKMNVCQMMTHCAMADEMFLGKTVFKRSFIGRLFGAMALKGFLKDESPMKKNMPTLPEIALKKLKPGNVLTAKKKWQELIEAYAHFSNPGFVHPFFGKMTREQMGYLVYKHNDHHLRQFNV